MKHGVYQIRNLVDGKRYIGSAAGRGGLHKRWIGGHLFLLLGYRHSIEAKIHMSEAKRGDKNGFYGKTHSNETKHKIAVSRIPYRGSRNPFAKLTELDVVQIKAYLRLNALTTDLAKQFNVAQTTISAIKNGYTWRHVK